MFVIIQKNCDNGIIIINMIGLWDQSSHIQDNRVKNCQKQCHKVNSVLEPHNIERQLQSYVTFITVINFSLFCHVIYVCIYVLILLNYLWFVKKIRNTIINIIEQIHQKLNYFLTTIFAY